jgi:hypothetical protein
MLPFPEAVPQVFPHKDEFTVGVLVKGHLDPPFPGLCPAGFRAPAPDQEKVAMMSGSPPPKRRHHQQSVKPRVLGQDYAGFERITPRQQCLASPNLPTIS